MQGSPCPRAESLDCADMARPLRLAAALLLLALCAFFVWLGVVVGLRAFDDHADSQPWVYLAVGGSYVAFGALFAVGALLLFRSRR